MQNPGVCQKCPILPIDIVIDPVANTLTIATVKGGQTISASNPIRYFTDGNGEIKMWERYSPVVFPAFTNTNGVWYFHFNNVGEPVSTQTTWTDFNVIASVYRFYLNDQLPDATKITVRAWEAHLNDQSASDHAWKHAQGTQWSGVGFDYIANVLAVTNGVPTSAPNADGRNTVFSLTGGKNSDDGLEYTVVNSWNVGNTTTNLKFNQDLGTVVSANLNATNSGLYKVRINDAQGRLSFLPATRFPFSWDATTNAPEYITALGVRTLVTDNRWMVNYCYALQDDVYGEAIKVVSAEVDFSTFALAQAHQWENLQALYTTLRDKELRPLWKVIHYVNKTGGSVYNVGCKYAAIVLMTDIRTQKVSNVSSVGSSSVLGTNVVITPFADITATDAQNALQQVNDKFTSVSADGSYPLTNVTVNGAIDQTLTPNRVFDIQKQLTGTLTLTIDTTGRKDTTTNDYMVQFSTGSLQTIVHPANVRWAEGVLPYISVSKTYFCTYTEKLIWTTNLYVSSGASIMGSNWNTQRYTMSFTPSGAGILTALQAIPTLTFTRATTNITASSTYFTASMVGLHFYIGITYAGQIQSITSGSVAVVNATGTISSGSGRIGGYISSSVAARQEFTFTPCCPITDFIVTVTNGGSVQFEAREFASPYLATNTETQQTIYIGNIETI